MTTEELRDELAIRGISGRQFAREVLGCSWGLVSHWLSGRRPIPEARVRAALADFDADPARMSARRETMVSIGRLLRQAKHLPRGAPVAETTNAPVFAAPGRSTAPSLTLDGEGASES